MKENRPIAIKFVLDREGGLTNDPHDPGRRTYKGISERYWPEWEGWVYINAGNFDEADKYVEQFYTENFWNVMGCDGLSSPLDIVAMDSAVNPGVGATKEFLKVRNDWIGMLFLRMKYYSKKVQEKPQKIEYFRGWINRVIALWEMVDGMIKE